MTLDRLGDRLIELIEPRRAPRSALSIWAPLAAASLVFAVWMALQPHRSADYWEIRSWVENASDHPYDQAAFDIDYPPQAIVVIVPLAMLPRAAAAWIMAGITLVSSAAMAWLFVRVTSELAGITLSRLATTASAATILAFGAVRCAIWMGQTTPIALVALLLGLRFARTRPLLASVCLAIGAFKLNILAGLLPALWLDGALVALGGCMAISALLSLAAAPILGYSVGAQVSSYLREMFSEYGSDEASHGVTSVRGLFHFLIANGRFAEALWIGTALVSLVWLCLVARRALKTPRTRAMVLSASLVWSLLIFFHGRYDLVLLAPVIGLLGWPEMRIIGRPRLRYSVLAGLLVFLVLDVPLGFRMVSPLIPWLDARDFVTIATIPSRLIVLALFGLLVIRLARPASSSFP